MGKKKFKEKKSIDFEKIDDVDALNQMKVDIDYFLAAIVKMMMVDNYDHFIPSGLTSFAQFFFSHYEIIYRDQGVPNKNYEIFLEWLNKKILDFK
jgi:hypothetical protein